MSKASYNGGACPSCGGELVERRVRCVRGKAVVDDAGPLIKTKCGACGRFIGYRDAVAKVVKRRPAEDETALWPDDVMFQAGAGDEP